jgi:hypothetical protein
MLEEKLIDISELRGACKLLNETGLLETKLKVVGTKKIDLATLFGASIEKMAENEQEEEIPTEAKDFYNKLFADEFVGAGADPDPDPTEKKEVKEKEKPKKEVKEKPKKEAKKKKEIKLSAFGHRLNTMAAALDEAFAKGASYEEAASAAGCKVPRAKDHLAHLKRDKGLSVRETKEGVFKVVQ